MAQRGLACSARRGRTHLGSAIRSADPENIYVMALRSLQRRERSGGCRWGTRSRINVHYAENEGGEGEFWSLKLPVDGRLYFFFFETHMWAEKCSSQFVSEDREMLMSLAVVFQASLDVCAGLGPVPVASVFPRFRSMQINMRPPTPPRGPPGSMWRPCWESEMDVTGWCLIQTKNEKWAFINSCKKIFLESIRPVNANLMFS